MRSLLAVLAISGLFAASASAESLESKLAELLARHELGASEAKDFQLEEAEANRYLRQQGEAGLPPGIENPWVRFDESVTVLGATLDLDEVKESLPQGGMLQLLSGRVPVELTARLTAEAGVGKLVLEKVLLSGFELPTSMVESMTKDAAPIPFLPGFRLGEAFPLPFGVESIRCHAGRVTLRQRATASK